MLPTKGVPNSILKILNKKCRKIRKFCHVSKEILVKNKCSTYDPPKNSFSGIAYITKYP